MKVIFDKRCDSFKNNHFQINDEGKVFYLGMPAKYFKPSIDPLFKSTSIYTVYGINDMKLGNISLGEQSMNELTNYIPYKLK